MRVRTLGILAVGVLAIGLVWWALGYATGMRPLSTGSGSTGPHGLRVAAQTPAALGPGPTAYAWHPGGSYVITVQIHNSASVPVTITGVDGAPSDWGGPVAGPTIENGDPRADPRFTTLGVFHDTQAVPLGDMKPVMTVPRSGC